MISVEASAALEARCEMVCRLDTDGPYSVGCSADRVLLRICSNRTEIRSLWRTSGLQWDASRRLIWTR